MGGVWVGGGGGVVWVWGGGGGGGGGGVENTESDFRMGMELLVGGRYDSYG